MQLLTRYYIIRQRTQIARNHPSFSPGPIPFTNFINPLPPKNPAHPSIDVLHLFIFLCANEPLASSYHLRLMTIFSFVFCSDYYIVAAMFLLRSDALLSLISVFLYLS